jgi:hypothetical protein
MGSSPNVAQESENPILLDLNIEEVCRSIQFIDDDDGDEAQH